MYTLEPAADAQPDSKQNATNDEIENQNKLHVAPPHFGRQLPSPELLVVEIHVGGGAIPFIFLVFFVIIISFT